METKNKVEQKFIDQAQFIARGTEILPGGVLELAKKLEKAQKNNKPLRVKLGLDPTRPDLHLGHSVVMRKLKQFQEAGHKVVLIVGGATAMIGDPSGKSETRPSLSKEQVEANAKTYFDQMSQIVDIEAAEVHNNAQWLHPMNLGALLKLASNVTIAQMMARDDFAKRYGEGKPISVHEFFYPLLQAYDSVEIDADIELGGTDQRFNVLMGREIQLAYGKEDPQLVMLLPLIEGTDGLVKMSKTYPEHCISLTEDPNNMYGKLMSIPDSLILKYYELLTDESTENINEIRNLLNDPTTNPRDIKMKLAFIITEQYNGSEAAQKAQNNFVNVVQNKGIPDDIQEIHVEEGKLLSDVIFDLGFVKSKGEAKRLILGGGVKINEEKVNDALQKIVFSEKNELILQAGKRNFAKLLKK